MNPFQNVLALKLYGKLEQQNPNRVAGEGGAGRAGFAPELVEQVPGVTSQRDVGLQRGVGYSRQPHSWTRHQGPLSGAQTLIPHPCNPKTPNPKPYNPRA